MSQHNDTGKKGEELSLDFLSRNGFAILHKNWRYRHWEIDVIAEKDGILHFIEIKTRTSESFGFPEENITKKKIQYLMNAATEFLYINPEWKRIQYDALSVLLKNNNVEYYLIEDIFL